MKKIPRCPTCGQTVKAKGKGSSNRTYSKVISTQRPRGNRGMHLYNRQEIYEWLYKNSDSRGMVVMTQKQVAERLGIRYQLISQIYSEFIAIGYIVKHGHHKNGAKFEIVHHPDELDWGDEFTEKIFAARQEYKNRNKEEI